jgi:hypothetical protein
MPRKDTCDIGHMGPEAQILRELSKQFIDMLRSISSPLLNIYSVNAG